MPRPSLVETALLCADDAIIEETPVLEGVAFVGSGSVVQGGGRWGDRVSVLKDCTIKFGAIFTAGTIICDGTQIGPCVICYGPIEDKPTMIGANCTIGGGTKIWPGVSICDGVTTGSDTQVRHDIIEPGTYVGQGRDFRRIR